MLARGTQIKELKFTNARSVRAAKEQDKKKERQTVP